MRINESFAVDAEEQSEFLQAVEAADVVTTGPDGLVATFLPLVLEPDRGDHGAFIAHIARNNTQWQHAGEALVIAHGPQGYVRPGWYASKAEHGRVAPTWNYATAHVYCDLIAHDDAAWVADAVDRLTNRFESGSVHPWRVSDAPEAYRNQMYASLVGLELVIRRVEMKFKMSQNRPDADIDGVVRGLMEADRHDLAEFVQRVRPQR